MACVWSHPDCRTFIKPSDCVGLLLLLFLRTSTRNTHHIYKLQSPSASCSQLSKPNTFNVKHVQSSVCKHVKCQTPPINTFADNVYYRSNWHSIDPSRFIQKKLFEWSVWVLSYAEHSSICPRCVSGKMGFGQGNCRHTAIWMEKMLGFIWRRRCKMYTTHYNEYNDRLRGCRRRKQSCWREDGETVNRLQAPVFKSQCTMNRLAFKG